MFNIEKDTLENALKPFDIVKTKSGEIAFIREVSVNNAQNEPKHQISYSVSFITENINNEKVAWYDNDDGLEFLCNMFVKIAQSATNNDDSVNMLFSNFK